ncbi:E3 ubiquitin ligase complex SCF subunit sconC-like [Drosophila subobscura]|uniref:E3 ubiquitin ligase complex SCF subunit sconC-like n=1 Tax=Drosophila subobscura TaxID=7241 RepID=UPI00155ABC06|nr:E3 ubiquitin ligase complex SCF subunit sconC-like [Drosophila subobscura]
MAKCDQRLQSCTFDAVFFCKQAIRNAGNTMSKIVLRTSDDVIFETVRKVAKCCRNIPLENEEEVPLRHVDANSLRKILEWAEHHQEDNEDAFENKAIEVPEWDMKFMAMPTSEIISLFSAAIHLDIKALMDLCCRELAIRIKGQSTEEMRETLNISSVEGKGE